MDFWNKMFNFFLNVLYHALNKQEPSNFWLNLVGRKVSFKASYKVGKN